MRARTQFRTGKPDSAPPRRRARSGRRGRRPRARRRWILKSFRQHARLAKQRVELRRGRLAVIEQAMELGHLGAQIDVESLRIEQLPGPPQPEQAVRARREVEPAEGQVGRQIYALLFFLLIRGPP